MRLETRYARSGDVSIAYQVVGERGVDLVYVPGWVSHLDYAWEEPRHARFLARLASFSRLILFDKRGTGLSDRVAAPPTLEQRMDDVRAVLDAVGAERAALFGVSEGGPMCALFAATYPQRAAALVMYGAYARRLRAPDYPWGATPEQRREFLEEIERGWGGPVGLAVWAPGVAQDEPFRRWWAAYLRMSASPGAALALARMNAQIDVRHVLPSIRVPTLVIHRSGDTALAAGGSRYMAERIPGARYVELPGDDHLPWVGDQDAILDAVQLFLTGALATPEPDRVLATVLVVEMVAATETAARLGDERWREALAAHQALVGAELARHRGREVRATGTGVVAVFDGPARAIRCAGAIVDGAGRGGIEVRAGLHTGECDAGGGDLGGVAVELAARVAAHAGPGDVLVSGTVKDLVAGSGIRFEDLGPHRFRGLPGDWRLFRVGRDPGGAPAAPPRAAHDAAAVDRHPVPLSRREREIAALLALGLSNRQIADELTISVGTADRHVANILNKLGYRSRAQVAAWAVEHGLLRARSG